MTLLYEKIENGSYKIRLAKSIYEREAVLAAAYKYGPEFVTKIEPEEPTHVVVYISVDEEAIAAKKISEFLQELIDQQLRLYIANRTAEIRKRVYDKAFCPIMGDKL